MIDAVKLATEGPVRATARLRVLALDEEFPYPLDSGKRIRTWNLLRRMAEHHAVRLVCFGPLSAEQSAVARSAGIEVRVLPALHPDRGVTLARRLAANLFSPLPYSVQKHWRADFAGAVADEVRAFAPSLIHCEWGPYVTYLRPHGDVPAVVVAHNVEATIWERRAALAGNPLSRCFFALQARRMRRFERTEVPRSGRVIAVSEAEAQTFRAWGADAVSVENGVDLRYYEGRPRTEVCGRILFLASLDWFPNVDALQYFVDSIFPHVRAHYPAASLRVVGRRLAPQLARTLRTISGVAVVGEVADVRDELNAAAVVAVPLRIGGGSRLKILEAFAAGKPVVSTSIGAEGLAVQDGVHLRIADEPRAFAEALVAVLSSDSERRRLGEQGRSLVEERYGWDALAKKLERIWIEAAGGQR